jgi:hypothetical protein
MVRKRCYLTFWCVLQILTSVPAVLHTTAVIMDSALTLRVDSTALVVKALWAMDTSVLVRTGTRNWIHVMS